MSLLMVRKYAPAHAADKNENIAQDSEIVALWQVLGDAKAYLREGKKNHNVKNVLAAAIKAAEKEAPNDRSVAEAKKVLAQFDAADADKSEELEREIKGDVVAVVSGNAARVSKDVSFSTAKEGVESFARKNGVSVVASQEYGEAYKFKFSAAIDCAAEDAAELNNYADLRAALSKMADIAKRLTDAKVSFKAGWTPDGIGEIILEFPNIEIARKYNYYKLFNAWEAARSQIVPRWAVNIGGYSIPRIEGNRMTIGILHFST